MLEIAKKLYVKAFNQLYITNKKGTSVLIVGVSSSSETFKRRLVYGVTVIFLATFYYIITKALEYKIYMCCIAMCSFSVKSFYL